MPASSPAEPRLAPPLQFLLGLIVALFLYLILFLLALAGIPHTLALWAAVFLSLGASLILAIRGKLIMLAIGLTTGIMGGYPAWLAFLAR